MKTPSGLITAQNYVFQALRSQRPGLGSGIGLSFGQVLAPQERDVEQDRSPPVERARERERDPEVERADPRPAHRVEPLPPAPRGEEAKLVEAATPTRSPVVEPPLQQLAAQMMRSICVHQLGDQSGLKLELSTPRLPKIGLDLRVQAGRLTARFSVADLAGRDLLRATSGDLAAGLAARGIDVRAIEVDLAPPARRQTGGESRQGRGRGQPRPPLPSGRGGRTL